MPSARACRAWRPTPPSKENRNDQARRARPATRHQQVRARHRGRARGAAAERLVAPHRRNHLRQGHGGGARTHDPRRGALRVRRTRRVSAGITRSRSRRMLRGRTIVVGVSGGIAAYKACELVRALRARRAAVVVVMTPAATQFVTPLTFQALSGNPALTTAFGDQHPALELPPEARARVRGAVLHVDLAEAADVLVIAPATADLIARLAHRDSPDPPTDVRLAGRPAR